MRVGLVAVLLWCAGVEFISVDASAISGGDAEGLLSSFVDVFLCVCW